MKIDVDSRSVLCAGLGFGKVILAKVAPRARDMSGRHERKTCEDTQRAEVKEQANLGQRKGRSNLNPEPLEKGEAKEKEERKRRQEGVIT